MRKIKLLFFVLLGTLFQLSAQDEPVSKKGNWHHVISMSANGNQAEYQSNLRGFGFRYIADFEVDETFRIGGGAGVNIMSPNEESYFFPLFLKAELVAGKNKILPLFGTEFGYGIIVNDSHWEENSNWKSRGGIYFHPTVGFGWKIHPELEFRTNIGYLFQRSKFIYDFEVWTGSGYENIRKVKYKRLTLNIGFRF